MNILGFLDVLYPSLCLNCEQSIPRHDGFLCFSCQSSLPYLSEIYGYDQSLVKNRMNQLVPIDIGYACFISSKDNMIQRLIKTFKYKQNNELGMYLSSLMADDFNKFCNNHPANFDAIIPIPIHKNKQKKRGYNQAEIIAQAISKMIEVPVYSDLLLKKTATQSQTLKSRWLRFSGNKDIFSVNEKHQNTFNHVLIVDDILTTGGTLEKAINILREAFPSTIFSIATLALSEY